MIDVVAMGELLIDFTENGMKLFRKPVNFTDPRYGYRKKTISASRLLSTHGVANRDYAMT